MLVHVPSAGANVKVTIEPPMFAGLSPAGMITAQNPPI
jgi:hypothetical protein